MMWQQIKQHLIIIVFVLVVQTPFIINDILSFEAIALWGAMVLVAYQRWEHTMIIGRAINNIQKLEAMLEKPKGRFD